MGNRGTVHLSWLDRFLANLGERGRELIRLPAADVPPLERSCRLAEALVSEKGEASGTALAHALLTSCSTLDATDRANFYRFLASHFEPDEARLSAAAAAYLEKPSAEQARALAVAAEPPRQELLRRMNMAPGATAALIAIRKDVLRLCAGEPGLKPLEADLRHVLTAWFNRGFLELRRIDWNTPAVMLEKLIAYEAVHEIDGWEDLRRRLGPDRRCFGFFHPRLSDEPLIFVEVALHKGMAGAIAPLIDRNAPVSASSEWDTAIFYSISNCQEGLRGISFGNFLIKQVVEELKTELPNLRRFATLSPVPGFSKWLAAHLAHEEVEIASGLEPDEKQVLLAAAGMLPGDDVETALKSILEKDGWWQETDCLSVLQPILMRLCALYLTETRDGKGPGDYVARFHLGNGARLESINWLGNTAPRGMAESFGMMVNYLYDPDLIEINHESFVHQGTVARSAEVETLLQPHAATPPQSANRIGRIVPFARQPKKKQPRASLAE
ncbi:MAG: Malonyl-CoA decarboxylase [Beijerinckiaceae bacterium]|nr:MAG: Malonyl-CoA decarboxylase [Beijerinckiaceae bacterium]